MIEAPTRDGIFRFDGDVLEVFAMDGSQRFHRALLPQMWIENGMLFVRRRDHTTLPWAFEGAQQALLEQLVQAVSAAS
jgi:hypothetical protein